MCKLLVKIAINTCLVAFFSIALQISAIASNVESCELVVNHIAHSTIVLPSNHDTGISDAAGILRDYIKKSSGAIIPILIENSNEIDNRDGFHQIHLGTFKNRTENTIIRSIPLTIDNDGYHIENVKGFTQIISKTQTGLEFGVYAFLEKYLGVRWLLPGELGEHVPLSKDIQIPQEKITEEPAFFSREISGFADDQHREWGNRNRAHGRVEFHHNMHNLYSLKQYIDTKPEFYNGNKNLEKMAKFDQRNKWQPCFTSPTLVQEGVTQISNYFKNSPNKDAYSLGVNDGGGFCEADIRASGYKKNNIGYYDLSDVYFGWANAVAEGVAIEYPDKWFGCLAYHEISQPPTTAKIHSRIIPFITEDRLRWVGDEERSEGYALNKDWMRSATQIGWYDYLYGTPYLIPRVYFHQLAKNLQYAHSQGVRAYYAEAYPNWGEGPKLFVALKLLWNPHENVDQLINEWCTLAVGEKASSFLKAYYALWEDYWTRRIVSTDWFHKKGQILKFWEPSYMDAVTYDDIKKSRELLESVVKNAKEPKQVQRAQLFLKSFEYYEASAYTYFGIIKKDSSQKNGDQFYQGMSEKRYRLVREYEDNNLLAHPIKFYDERFELLTLDNIKNPIYFHKIRLKLKLHNDN